MVASRPSSKELPWTAAPNLIAYHHNNPVNAGIVKRAGDSSRTSHRSYIHGDAKEWLAVDLGLALCDLGTSETERNRFDALVDERVGMDPPDHNEELEAHRRTARVCLGSSVELGSPRQSSTGALITDLFAPKDATLHLAWPGSLQEVVAQVSKVAQISAGEICSKSRRRPIARARRIFVLCAHVELHRPIGEVAAAIGISSPAARQLEQRATSEERHLAATVADRVRRLTLAAG